MLPQVGTSAETPGRERTMPIREDRRGGVLGACTISGATVLGTMWRRMILEAAAAAADRRLR